MASAAAGSRKKASRGGKNSSPAPATAVTAAAAAAIAAAPLNRGGPANFDAIATGAGASRRVLGSGGGEGRLDQTFHSAADEGARFSLKRGAVSGETGVATAAGTATGTGIMRNVSTYSTAGAGTVRRAALTSPSDSPDEGLHRLCAALRNVEAMADLHGSAIGVQAAEARSPERFPLKGSEYGGGGRGDASGGATRSGGVSTTRQKDAAGVYTSVKRAHGGEWAGDTSHSNRGDGTSSTAQTPPPPPLPLPSVASSPSYEVSSPLPGGNAVVATSAEPVVVVSAVPAIAAAAAAAAASAAADPPQGDAQSPWLLPHHAPSSGQREATPDRGTTTPATTTAEAVVAEAAATTVTVTKRVDPHVSPQTEGSNAAAASRPFRGAPPVLLPRDLGNAGKSPPPSSPPSLGLPTPCVLPADSCAGSENALSDRSEPATGVGRVLRADGEGQVDRAPQPVEVEAQKPNPNPIAASAAATSAAATATVAFRELLPMEEDGQVVRTVAASDKRTREAEGNTTPTAVAAAGGTPAAGVPAAKTEAAALTEAATRAEESSVVPEPHSKKARSLPSLPTLPSASPPSPVDVATTDVTPEALVANAPSGMVAAMAAAAAAATVAAVAAAPQIPAVVAPATASPPASRLAASAPTSAAAASGNGVARVPLSTGHGCA